ncbi:ROK family protein [Arthrobacter echini]|uniref:fructokinase n=1 Tax=Arthrobacter echini TaxID=1529066 RepID=A0A4S5EAE4_9MICC|nr:ROK family protein [Arthrobacter echini]THJ68560.1 ROK family protein [Arthrobacter echini]
MIAGIETGGTKVICAVADRQDPGTILADTRIETTSPEETLAAIRDFLADHADDGRFDAVGIASFGPVDVDVESPRFGWITSTPKPGWRSTDLLENLHLASGTPVRLVSDVTGAALGEHRSGAGRGVSDLAYVTVGTGVGAGLVVDGGPLSWRSHPELGHILVRRHPRDRFAGNCPFHGDCLEGLVSGPAIEARWGKPGTDLGPRQQESVVLSGYYIAQLLATITYATAPQRIIAGGGVMKTPGLLDVVREQLARLVGTALAEHPLTNPAGDYVVRPELGDESGVRGALSLASDAMDAEARP